MFKLSRWQWSNRRTPQRALASVVGLLAAFLVAVTAASSLASTVGLDETLLMSRSSGALGAIGDQESAKPSTTQTGDMVTFASQATNLVAGDTNGMKDVFIRTLATDTTTRITPNASNGASYAPSFSGDGRFIAFASAATNLVPGDTNGADDIFVFDRTTGVISRVTPTTGNGNSFAPSISGDGRLITYQSVATNLVPGDTNGTDDIFVFDRVAGTTIRVSVSSAGVQGNASSSNPAIAGDGGVVSFESAATNLDPADQDGGETDVFIHELATNTTAGVSLALASGSRGPAVSFTGRYVAFASDDCHIFSGCMNIFRFDRETNSTTLITQATGNSGEFNRGSAHDPTISDDGRCVAFRGNVDNGGSPGRQIWVRDVLTGTTTLLSQHAGTPGNEESTKPAISGDGRLLYFLSLASNLVPGDTNNAFDVFIRNACDTPAPPVEPPAPPPTTPAPPPTTPAPPTVAPVATQTVAPSAVRAGSSGIHGPAQGCRARLFTVRVTGALISQVKFYLDGKRITSRASRRSQSGARWSVTIDPSNLRPGVHRVIARITFRPEARTAPRTDVYRFARCSGGTAKRLLHFTG